MERTRFSIRHYLDACVAVKLVTKESGHETIEEFIRENLDYPCLITEFAFYETLSALKGKWCRRDKNVPPDQKLNFEQYRCAIAVLDAYVDERLLQIDDEFCLNGSKIIYELGVMVKAHNIDYSDALQIHTVLNGKWSMSIGSGAAPVFVTTDEALSKAGKAMGLQTWWFGHEPHPLSE